MYRLPDTLNEDITRLGRLARQFGEGELDGAKFKIARVPMGIYEQRQDGTYMVRIRTTGGVITPGQLTDIIAIARRHRSNLLHVTTRQEIQIQNLQLKEVETILTELQEIGLSSKGGGGNTVRNILVSPDSGIAHREVFDPTPHSMALTSKLIAEPDSFSMPRKLKIAFSNHPDRTDYAAINDLGLVAHEINGQRGFKVYLGGSVASKPTVGWIVSEFIPEGDLYALAEAVKQLFSRHGNRKNKHKARLRYIFYRLGEQETLRLFEEYMEQARLTEPRYVPQEREDEPLPRYEYVPGTVPDLRFGAWKNRYATEQRQKGYYSVLVPIIHGNIPLDNPRYTEHFAGVIRFVSSLGKHTIRFTPHQNILLRNIPETALPDLFNLLRNITDDICRPLVVNNIVSCTGADTCRLGICLSKGLASAIRKKLANGNLELDRLSHLRVHISGCPNSCGQQVWADLGFSGKVLRNDRIYPGYQVFAGASRDQNPELAESLGHLAARDIPQFVENLFGHYLETAECYPDFRSYLNGEGKAYIKKQLDRHTVVPSFEDDKNYYLDWSAEQIFSVAGRGAAECSAGIFDMIDIDKASIEENRKKLAAETNSILRNRILYDILLASARMLLVTRGGRSAIRTRNLRKLPYVIYKSRSGQRPLHPADRIRKKRVRPIVVRR